MNVTEKACSKCRAVKPAEAFYKNHRKTTGLESQCKTCAEQKRRETGSHRAWAQKNYSKRVEVCRAWRKRNPGKGNGHPKPAHRALQQAIKSGSVVRPTVCSACAIVCTPHGHHPDYSRPLDVVWLCRRCHAAEHYRIEHADGTVRRGEGT